MLYTETVESSTLGLLKSRSKFLLAQETDTGLKVGNILSEP
jgi:hypothetical protein